MSLLRVRSEDGCQHSQHAAARRHARATPEGASSTTTHSSGASPATLRRAGTAPGRLARATISPEINCSGTDNPAAASRASSSRRVAEVTIAHRSPAASPAAPCPGSATVSPVSSISRSSIARNASAPAPRRTPASASAQYPPRESRAEPQSYPHSPRRTACTTAPASVH